MSEITERVAGIEPAFQPWEGRVLPLNHTRERCDRSETTGIMSIRESHPDAANAPIKRDVVTRWFGLNLQIKHYPGQPPVTQKILHDIGQVVQVNEQSKRYY